MLTKGASVPVSTFAEAQQSKTVLNLVFRLDSTPVLSAFCESHANPHYEINTTEQWAVMYVGG